MRPLAILLFTLSTVYAAESATPGWHFTETGRRVAPEARQGVAADSDFLYVISNHALAKYRKATGERTAEWSCPEGEPLTHLNAGIVVGGRLHCAHSNYPGVPHESSIEIWDTATLRHVASRALGLTEGSLTWIDRREGRWLACFVHYIGKGGQPGRGPEWTRIVEYDDEWRQTGGWALPLTLIRQVGSKGYSLSGGAIGPGGHLYVTGHDEKELYVLSFPAAGTALTWIATLPIPAEGQAFGWDQADPMVLHLILKRTREVITGRLTMPPTEPPTQKLKSKPTL